MNSSIKISEIKSAINEGRCECKDIVKEALESGIDPIQILNSATEAIRIVGDRFGRGEVFLTNLIFAGECMKTIIETLEPRIKDREMPKERKVKIVIGTVQGDIHDLGKNVVIACLEAEGFQVIDLGVDVPPSAFIDKAEEYDADVIAASALLTSTREYLRDISDLRRDRGLREKKFIVGGAQVTAEFSEEIGADGYAEDAPRAVKLVRNLLRLE